MPSYIGNPPAQVIELDDNEVTTPKILDGAVTTPKVNDAAVTNDKLAGSIANDKLTNSSITINGTAISLGGSGEIVAGLDWQTVKTTSFTAVSQEGYPVDTTSSTIIVTLPASPSAGDNIAIVDYAGTFNSNNCVVDPNGNKIEGFTTNQVLQTNRVAINLTYIDSTQGWLITSEGSSTPITAPEITWDTAAGTVGTITDAQRSGGYSLSSCGGSANIGSPTFSITSGALPTGLSMSSSGVISGTVTNPVSLGTVFNFTVTGSISVYGYTETRNFTVTVSAPIITFDTASGSIGTINDNQRSSYTLSPVTATVTSGTLSYAIQSGSLPSGLSLNTSNGAITGTANAVSSNTTSTFTIRATTTSASVFADRQFSILVNAPIITFDTASGSIGTVEDKNRANGSYTLSPVTATVTSGSLTYAVTVGALPASVSLNSSTGAITGNFDAVGSDTTTTFTITATETTTSVTASRQFSITVNAPVDVSYLLVAGGAGGGSGGFFGAGGGGAGGLLTGTISAASGSYSISIGGGGGGAGGTSRGGNGGNSSIGGVATAIGGGGGAAVSSGAGSNRNGASGGSGGGGGHDGGSGSGGAGTSGQGNNGGNGQQDGGGGGGGGKGSVGSAGGGGGGAGGTGGQYSTIATATSSGDNGYYASGGSGGNNGTAQDGGGGASGGSGQGNTGGGGGKQASGGSGICIMYYTAGSQLGSGGTVYNSGGVYYHKFTSGGTFSI